MRAGGGKKRQILITRGASSSREYQDSEIQWRRAQVWGSDEALSLTKARGQEQEQDQDQAHDEGDKQRRRRGGQEGAGGGVPNVKRAGGRAKARTGAQGGRAGRVGMARRTKLLERRPQQCCRAATQACRRLDRTIQLTRV